MQHYMEVNDWKTALNKRTKQRIVPNKLPLVESHNVILFS